jgi:hypothetical protein
MLADCFEQHQSHGGLAMGLLAVFVLALVIGQAFSIGLGLLVERHTTPYTGLVTFISAYFLMFWLAWRFAVRITGPSTRLGAWLGARRAQT